MVLWLSGSWQPHTWAEPGVSAQSSMKIHDTLNCPHSPSSLFILQQAAGRPTQLSAKRFPGPTGQGHGTCKSASSIPLIVENAKVQQGSGAYSEWPECRCCPTARWWPNACILGVIKASPRRDDKNRGALPTNLHLLHKFAKCHLCITDISMAM